MACGTDTEPCEGRRTIRYPVAGFWRRCAQRRQARFPALLRDLDPAYEPLLACRRVCQLRLSANVRQSTNARIAVVRDINTMPAGVGSDPSFLGTLNGWTYLAATDGVHASGRTLGDGRTCVCFSPGPRLLDF